VILVGEVEREDEEEGFFGLWFCRDFGTVCEGVYECVKRRERG